MVAARGPLARRLMVGQSLVLAGMAVTIVVVAILVGPAVFDDHMRQAGHANQPDVLQHAQEAFFSAGLLSIGVGLLVAIAGALAVTSVTTARLGRWLTALKRGAERVSSGRYEQPVVLPRTSPELERVADAFNAMSAEIQNTEARRRTLLTDVAHEMRTPLAAIDITLEAVEDGLLSADAGTMATLRAQSRRLARLAEDIRDVSAAEEGHMLLDPGPVSTEALISDVAAQWQRPFREAGVALHMEVEDSVVVCVDEARVAQVLDNLLANALRHTDKGGHVRLTAAVSGSTAHVSVTDDGEGIDASALPHIMERFFRADPARTLREDSGTGVGLAISRAIARRHGGDLVADSAGLGRGATFTLSLPASCAC